MTALLRRPRLPPARQPPPPALPRQPRQPRMQPDRPQRAMTPRHGTRPAPRARSTAPPPARPLPACRPRQGLRPIRPGHASTTPWPPGSFRPANAVAATSVTARWSDLHGGRSVTGWPPSRMPLRACATASARAAGGNGGPCRCPRNPSLPRPRPMWWCPGFFSHIPDAGDIRRIDVHQGMLWAEAHSEGWASQTTPVPRRCRRHVAAATTVLWPHLSGMKGWAARNLLKAAPLMPFHR